MLNHAVRPLLRVALLSVLFGAVPPAPMPVVRATADRAAAVAGPPVVPAQAAAPSAPLVAPASTAVPHPEPPPPSLPAHPPWAQASRWRPLRRPLEKPAALP